MAFFLNLVTPTTCNAKYPLSDQSKEFMTIAACFGALVGGCIGGAVYADSKQNSSGVAPSGISAHLKELCVLLSHVVVTAAIGAVLAGGISYFFTYEKTLESLENRVIDYTTNADLSTVLAASPKSIKRDYLVTRYPLHASLEKLNDWYQRILSLKNQLLKIIASGISPLKGGAHACLEKVEEWLARLGNSMDALMNDPQYVFERTQQMQDRLVAAQQRAADAAWYNATHRPQPQVIVVHQRK